MTKQRIRQTIGSNNDVAQFMAPVLRRKFLSSINKGTFQNEYPDYMVFLDQNGFLVDKFEIMIPVRWFRNEMQPTKAYLEGNKIFVNYKYLKTGDAVAWLIHELGHLFFYQKRGRVLDNDYPENLEERFAFGLQFLYCKTKNIHRDEVMEGICSCYSQKEIQRYRTVFEKLWDDVDLEYLQQLIDNEGGSRKS